MDGKRLGPALSYPEFQSLEVDMHLCSPNPVPSEQNVVVWDGSGQWDASIIHLSKKYLFLDNHREAIGWNTAWVALCLRGWWRLVTGKHLYLGRFQMGKIRPHTELHRGSQSQSIVPAVFAVGVSLLGSLSVLNSIRKYIIVVGPLDFLPQVTHPGTPLAC